MSVLILVTILCQSALAGSHTFSLSTGVPGQKVYLASQLDDWDAETRPLAETAPGRYSLSLEEPWLHELQYKFVVDGRWLVDPDNERTSPDGHGGVNSLALFPDFHEDPLLSRQPGVPVWDEAVLHVTDLEGADRAVTVLSPPAGFAKGGGVTVYFQDGGDYLARAGAANLLANLSVEEGMPALVGVFIPPKDRMREYEFLDAYADFVAGPLVAAVERRWNTGGARERRLLIGPSLGGLITLYTVLRHPDVFGLAASQSGSTWFDGGRIVPLLAAARGSGLKLFLDVGLYESPDMLLWNRRAAEAAAHAGLEHRYREYPSTHDWIGWRNRLAETLRFLSGHPLENRDGTRAAAAHPERAFGEGL